MSKINRRTFFAGLGSGILALGLGKSSKGATAGQDKESNSSQSAEELKIKKYNTLGNTGIKTSDIIFGTTSFFSPNVVKYAYELGINVFDTGETYMGGRSEEYLGKALKDVRDKVIIITKHFGERAAGQKFTKSALIDKLNGSLKRLQTDYVDFALFHGLTGFDMITRDDLFEGYQQLKKEGKIRFTGFSTHNAKVTLQECLKPEYADFVQLVLFMYNHMEGKKIEPLIKSVREKGIATAAIKTLAGGQQGKIKDLMTGSMSYPQAAVAWVLSNPSIDCAVLSMRSFSHVEEYIAASGRKLARADLAMLRDYHHKVHNQYCRVTCNECEAHCPNGVAISDVMRYEMYFENYGHEKEAVRQYALLTDDKKPLLCRSCRGECNRACPFGIDVRNRLIHTNEILSV